MLHKGTWRWLAAVTVVAGAWVSGATAAPSVINFQFKISDKVTIFAQANGNELRMASTLEGVATATALKSQGAPPPRFAETPLPIPADMLPTGCTGMKAQVMIYPQAQGQSYVLAMLKVTRLDKEKIPWTYLTTLAGMQAQKKDVVLDVPAMDKLTLEVATKDLTKDSARTLGVGVHLKAGTADLTGVQKNGVEVNLQMRTTDSAGKEIANVAKPISSFGFS